MKNFIYLFGLFFSLISCSYNKYSADVEEALRLSGDNRKQLEMVLDKYYKKNKLKYEAACFLISNMPYHQSKNEIELDSSYISYFDNMDSLYRVIYRENINKQLSTADSIKKAMIHSFNNLHTPLSHPGVLDIQSIDAVFLIENIESAFQEWDNNLLLKNMSFDDFKEAILPYRTTNECLHFRRSGLKEKYIGVLSEKGFDDVRTIIGEYEKTMEGLRDLHRAAKPKGHMGLYDLYMSDFKRNCFNITTWSCNIFRACGVPVYFEFTPQYRDRNTSHFWCASPDSTHIPLPYTVPDNNLMDDWERELKYSGKVYRRTFGANKETPFFTAKEEEEVPSELNIPTLVDVTWRYHKTVTLRIPIDTLIESNNAYLCLFNSKRELTAVGWGKVDLKNKEVIYEQVPVNQLYFPAYYEDEELIPFSKPFILITDSLADIPEPFTCNIPYKSMDLRIKNGELIENSFWKRKPKHVKYKLLECTTASQDVHVIRKYPEKRHFKEIYETMKGAVVVAYNDKQEYDTIFRLDVALKPYIQEFKLCNEKKYTHYFFSVPNRQANIAEMEYLGNDILPDLMTSPTPLPIFEANMIKEDTLKKIIGSPFKYGQNPWAAFDGNLETYAGGRLVGMEFSIPVRITHIRLAPRNANNMIVIGDRYELMYYDNGWKSGGHQIARYNYLIFRNIPSNTIYWLKNLDHGKEELPFFYTSGQQRFISENLEFLSL